MKDRDLFPRKLSNEELDGIESISPKMSALTKWAYNQFSCSHCGKCTRRCEVLSEPDLDMGAISDAYDTIMSFEGEERIQATIDFVSSNYLMYNALRRCCFCGFCTAACRRHVLAPDKMRVWRQLFMEADLMPPDDSKLVMVDNEWNIFSAYRAIYGISYPEFMSLDQAADDPSYDVDTLLFPGCSLVSYTPELIDALGGWLNDCGIKWALSDACCGSPLMSAGLFDRAHALREGIIEKMHRAGITKMITVCPGCTDEFHEELPADIEIIPLPEILLEYSEKRISQGYSSGFAPMDLSSVTFFDSCHDRNDMRNALAIRALLALHIEQARQIEMDHHKKGALCCGAGGAVSSYDPEVTDRRVWRIIDEAKATGAKTLISMCPTCSYTFGQANISSAENGIESLHYLEALFGIVTDWPKVFDQLNSMWYGEYGPWLNATFF